MTNVRRSWLVTLVGLMAISWLTADELYLTDGRVVEGEVVSSAGSETIDIRVGSAGLVAIQHFPRAQVERVVYGVSARQTALSELNQQVAALSKRTDATSDEWWHLARKLQERGETAAAKDLAVRVLALDRHHGEARKMLGMTRCQGVWMRVNESAVARGDVFFRGSWVTWAMQEQTLLDEARRRDEQLSARKERDEQRRQARLTAAIAAENAAVTYPETYVSGYYRSPYYNPFGGWHGPAYGPGYPAYPIVRPPVCGPGIGWHIGASGGGSNSAWSFSWNGASGGGYRVR